jgi:hypothetical protein
MMLGKSFDFGCFKTKRSTVNPLPGGMCTENPAGVSQSCGSCDRFDIGFFFRSRYDYGNSHDWVYGIVTELETGKALVPSTRDWVQGQSALPYVPSFSGNLGYCQDAPSAL